MIEQVKNETGILNLDSDIERRIKTAIAMSDDPFLKLIDRDNMNVIHQENQLSLSGITSEDSPQIGNLISADAFISIRVSIAGTTYRICTKALTGYEAYPVGQKQRRNK